MLQKTKIIAIALAALLIITLFFLVQAQRTHKMAAQERDDAKREGMTLDKKLQDVSQENARLQEKIGSLNSDIERIARDREDLQRKYELANKEKESLIERLKAKAAEKSAEAKQPVEQQAGVGDAYWAGVLKAKTDMEIQLANVRNDLKLTQINNEELLRQKNGLDLDIKNLNRQNDELRQQLVFNQKMIDNVAQELVIEKNNRMQLENSSKVFRGENAALRRQVRTLNEQKADLERKATQLQGDSKGLKDNLQKIESLLNDKLLMIEDLKRQVGIAQRPSGTEELPDSKSAVELPPIVVRPQQETMGAPAPVTKGEVVLVNKENNFVIVNMGEDAGVKLGDSFKVYRDGNYIASVDVIQARRSFSACDIKQEDSPIRVGDKVK